MPLSVKVVSHTILCKKKKTDSIRVQTQRSKLYPTY